MRGVTSVKKGHYLRIRSLVLVTTLLLAATAAYSQIRYDAPRRLQATGVQQLAVSPVEDGAIQIELQDSSRLSLGTITARAQEDSRLTFRFVATNGDTFLLTWDTAAAMLTLTESDGRSYTLSSADNDDAPAVFAVARAAFAARKAQISAIAESFANLRDRGAIRIAPNTLEGGSCPDLCSGTGTPGGGGIFNKDPYDPSNRPGGYSCNGDWVRGSATAVQGQGIVRSDLCAQAEKDANYQCMNRYCTGCCEFRPCDAMCMVGDYFCAVAGISGHACSY